MSFFLDGDAPDITYDHVRSAEYFTDRAAHDFTEELWEESRLFLDPDVQSGAQRDFAGRFWEMYAARTLLRHGLPLVRTADRNLRAGGPDLEIEAPRAFVECMAPRGGNGPDAVKEPQLFVVTQVPREAIILRIRAAIHEKWSKYQRYMETQAVSASDPYIVAINGAGIPMARGDPEMPYVVQAVLPFGRHQYHVDRDTMAIVGMSFEQEYELRKKSGAPVATDVFLSPEYRGISVVMYGHVHPVNRDDTIGNEFVVVHNPHASNPFPRDVLPCELEFWVEDERLRVTDRRSPRGAT